MNNFKRKIAGKNLRTNIKKRASRTLRRILCYTLTVSLLIQNNVLTAEARTDSEAMSVQTKAQTDIGINTMNEDSIAPSDTNISGINSETDIPQTEESDVQPEVLNEIEEKRDTFSKEYLLSDNSRVLVVYPQPIHYETEEGNLAEIDNSLTRTEEGYTNGNNSYEVVITARRGLRDCLADDGACRRS